MSTVELEQSYPIEKTTPKSLKLRRQIRLHITPPKDKQMHITDLSNDTQELGELEILPLATPNTPNPESDYSNWTKQIIELEEQDTSSESTSPKRTPRKIDFNSPKSTTNLLRESLDETRALLSPFKRSFSHGDLDNLEQEEPETQTNSFDVLLSNKNRFSFWATLKEEIMTNSEVVEDHSKKREAIYNFLQVPLRLEKLLFFGFVLCCDSFLFLFTFMPIRILLTLIKIVCLPFSNKVKVTRMNVWDLLRGLIILVSVLGLNFIDTSVVYHYIRGQAIIKLYVIFNVLEIFDKLCCSFGQDIFDSLFSRARVNNKEVKIEHLHLHPVTVFLVALIYTFIHSLVLFFQVVTLNVAVNSHSNALLTLLISNQFVELKGSVFKKFEKENLFQISCNDMVERFQLVIFLLIITLQNFKDLEWDLSSHWVTHMGLSIIMCIASELVVDWIKHAFITKFNKILPDVYRQFTESLRAEMLDTSSQKSFMVDTHTVSRIIGFVPLPLACVLLRIFPQLLFQFTDLRIGIAFFVSLYIVGCVVKIMIRMEIVKLSLAQYKRSLLDLGGQTPSKVPNRFALVKGKIP